MKYKRRAYGWAGRLLAVLAVALLLGSATSSLAQEGNPNREAQEAGLAEDGGVDAWDLAGDLDAMMGKVIVIPPSAFVQDGLSTDKYRIADGYVVGVNGDASMLAPVMLPEGATRILTVWVYAKDKNPLKAAGVCFRRTLLSLGKTALLGCVGTSDSTEVEAYRITYPKAWQNLSNNRAYQLTLGLPEDVYVYGMKVVYE